MYIHTLKKSISRCGISALATMWGTGSLLNMLDDSQWKEKHSSPAPLASFLLFFIFLCASECRYITANTKPQWQATRFGVAGRRKDVRRGEKNRKKREKSEQSRSGELERRRYLAVQLRPLPHTVSLQVLGPPPSNCGSAH